ncbi:MAG: DMT family transporter [Woeseiaceae bacterium]|nr:DMT family transporter [Woeseiaceae bacterium]
MKMTARSWAMLALLSFLWGCSYFLIEIALELPVLLLVAVRIMLAAVVLWAYVLLRGEQIPKQLSVWTAFLVMGLLNNVIPFSLIVWGQTEITSSLASILNATTPLFAVLIAAVWLRDEPVTPAKIIGVVIGFVGVSVMIGPGALTEIGGEVLAEIAVVLAGLSYACAGAFGRRFHRLNLSPAVAAAGQVTMSSLVLGAVVLLTHDFSVPLNASITAWAAVAAMAVFSTAFAYLLYFRLLATAGATNLMLVTFLIPVTAILLGVFLLQETLSAYEIGGMLLIFFALIVIDGRVFGVRR